MSSISFELEADVRQDTGKGASRRLRHTNKVPAVVYGADKDAQSLTLDHNKVIHALSHEAFYSHILTLKVEGKKESVILKDLQRDPSAPRILHMDFLRIKADQKLQMHIPLHFIGDELAPGVKDGGVISHLIADVEVSCLPANLPEFIEVDTSKLGMNETLHLSDLKLPKGVELTAFAHGAESHDHPVVSIHKPRIIDEEVSIVAEEETEEGATTEEAAPAADSTESKE
jgi:large subunit ribosomal protein L25